MDITPDEALTRLNKIFEQNQVIRDLDTARQKAHQVAKDADKRYDLAVIELRKLSQPDPEMPLFEEILKPKVPKPAPSPEASAAGKVLAQARTKSKAKRKSAAK